MSKICNLYATFLFIVQRNYIYIYIETRNSCLSRWPPASSTQCLLPTKSWNAVDKSVWSPTSAISWATTDTLALIAWFMGPTLGPSGADRTQVDPMSAPWTLLSGDVNIDTGEDIVAFGLTAALWRDQRCVIARRLFRRWRRYGRHGCCRSYGQQAISCWDRW